MYIDRVLPDGHGILHLSDLARRPDARRRIAGERLHHVVQAPDERGRIVQLTALGKRRLIEQDMAPVGEPALVRFVASAAARSDGSR